MINTPTKRAREIGMRAQFVARALRAHVCNSNVGRRCV